MIGVIQGTQEASKHLQIAEVHLLSKRMPGAERAIPTDSRGRYRIIAKANVRVLDAGFVLTVTNLLADYARPGNAVPK